LRYYSIVLGGTGGSPPANFPALSGGGVSGATWSSQINGQNDPGALDIELDVFSTSFAIPSGNSFVRIWGIPLQQIAQASQLNKVLIDVYAGMAKGLPLANPAQQGLIAHGTIWPAFGNWIDTDMTLDLVLQAPFGNSNAPDTPRQPAPIVHNWKQGQPLATAIKNTLATAFPNFTPQINILPNLVLNYSDTGFYRTIESYAGYIRDISQSIMGSAGYPGVHIFPSGKNLVVTDGTQSGNNPKQILFQDLIGQPTWLGLNTVSVKTVMRGDILAGSKVTLPQTLAVTSAASASQFKQSSAFQGSFFVQSVRHVGRFRQPDGHSWCSIFTCAALNSPAG
jgi:hypothetical protein